MKQYGDITKLSGYELDPVDLIVGGSPCQDLSVAGKRAGLDGERSGLFMEMIRIIREMREKTNGIYPRYALWENVPGAFSSNEGRDFSVVLGEFARLIESGAPDVPVPKEGWPESGVLLVGSGGSVAYRTHDSQYWGVPQRRRRIALVADLRGQSAPEILFERKGVSGHPEQSGETGKRTSGETAESTGETGEPIMIEMTSTKNTICQGGTSPTLTARMGTGGNQVNAVLEESQGSGINEDVAFTLNATDRHAVFDSQVYHGCKEFTDGISQTVNAQYGTGGNNQPLVVERIALSIGNGQTNNISMSDKANALDTMHDQQAVMQSQTFGVDPKSLIGSSLKARNDGSSNCDVVISALCADDYKGPNRQYVDGGKCQITNNIVRRLTPLEAERLQGFPDRWTDIPGASDSKRYKALGNSIALPFWEFLAHRFVMMGEVKSIGSLFDGIGGFPLCFKRAGAVTKWTSEIEPFCEAVVKYHIDNGDL